MPDCHENASVYCDESWRGFLNARVLLERHELSWSAQTGRPDADGQVWIWPNPPHIPSETIANAVDSGARILVLDETDTSLDWYRSFFHADAESADSPVIREASHINGNPSLPVFPITEDIRSSFGLPDESTSWRIALNHPAPVIQTIPDDESKKKAIFLFALHSNNPHSSGAIYVIRDESFMTNLMLNTLDNGKLYAALVSSLCGDDRPCRIRMFERGFVQSAEQTADEAGEETFTGGISKKARELRKDMSEFAENFESARDRIPLFMMIFALFSAWSVLALAATFPWGRTRPK